MSNLQQQQQQAQDDRPTLKRPRPTISCLACRKKKLKCDRLLPCQQCLKGGRDQSCEYAAGQEPELRENAADTNNATIQVSPFRFEGSSIGKEHESRQVDELLDRLKSLEHALQKQLPSSYHELPARNHHSSSRSSLMDVDQREAEAEDVLPEEDSESPLLTRFHQAHQFIKMLPTRADDEGLKDMAAQIRAIKGSTTIVRRTASALYSSNHAVIAHMLRLLPEQAICEKLIILYFENFEHCARILHRPTFLKQTHLFCTSQLDEFQSTFYVPMLVGVLSIAASLNTLPECDLPNLHGRIDGVDAGQLLERWFKNLPVKEQNSIAGLQVRLLSMQSQKIRHGSSGELWMSCGQLIRQAMLMQLHKKAPPDTNTVDQQIRQWLWLTILEQDLALSIMCGMAPHDVLMSVSSPINVNDEDLDQRIDPSIRVYSSSNWTDSLCQHVLAKSFIARSRAYGLQFRSEGRLSYSEVMEHARHLENILRELPAPFKLDQNNPPGRLMAQMEFDVTLRRPLIALYAPFGKLMPLGDIYREARIAWVQSSLVVLCFQDLFDPKYPVIDVPQPEGYWDLYYTVYRHDIISGLQAELLELQRMKDARPALADTRTDLGLQKHAARSHTRALPWTVDGMTKSVEDTLDPLVRRVGREGADLRDVVLWTIVFDSLCSRECDDLVSFVRLGLNQLINVLRARLNREGYEISAATATLWYSRGTSSVQDDRANLHWLSEFLQGGNDP